jgi:hypothetical protein
MLLAFIGGSSGARRSEDSDNRLEWWRALPNALLKMDGESILKLLTDSNKSAS